MDSMVSPTMVPKSGVIGLPSGIKESGKRVDLKPDDFTLLIETKGYRLAWSRASPCPCTPVNAQTQQPDPNCAVCEGSGWLFFAPSEAITSTAGDIDELQQIVIDRHKAGVIRGIMTSGSSADDPYDKITSWRDGEMSLTVRPENKIGYYDRIVNLDQDMVFAENFQAGATSTTLLSLRYDVKAINLLRSIDTVYEAGVDFDLKLGQIKWNATKQPVVGTQLVAHYHTYPTWLVVRHPHVVRATVRKFKTKNPSTPQGTARDLPIQALVKYEFLAKP